MKSNYLFAIGMVITLSVLFLSEIQACENGAVYKFEHMTTISKKAQGVDADTESYPFSTGRCVKLINQKSNRDAKTNEHITANKISQG